MCKTVMTAGGSSTERGGESQGDREREREREREIKKQARSIYPRLFLNSQTHKLPASASLVLGLQACTTTQSCIISFYLP
jgi:hypothetical protein